MPDGEAEEAQLPPRELEPRESLRADCGRCVGLCCVALSFKASDDFAADKPAGLACPNLVGGSSCGIHDHLRSAGYRGCATFDCFGAGQHVTGHTCAGVRWEGGGEGAAGMFAVFDVMRRLKQMLWLLADAARIARVGPLREEVDRCRRTVQDLVWEPAAVLESFDVLALQDRVLRLLADVSAAHRAGLEHGSGLPLAGSDLRDADFSGADLRGADLRHARLATGVLAGADLTSADLFGADLRDTDVRGARLAGSLYLTQMQVEAAQGDEATTLPPAIRRPAHWLAEGDASV